MFNIPVKRLIRYSVVFLFLLCVSYLQRNILSIFKHHKNNNRPFGWKQLDFSSHRKLFTPSYVKTNTSKDKTLDNLTNRTFNKSVDREVFLRCENKIFYGYSAIIINLHQKEAEHLNLLTVVAVTGLQRKSKLPSFCCSLLKNGSTVCSQPLEKHVRYPDADFDAVQYKCPVNIQIPELYKITICHSITRVVFKTSVYHVNVSENSYMNVSYPFTDSTTGHMNIGICSKTAYQNVSAEVLIEWFELQRFLKVDKVVSDTYHLNTNAMKVLQYYASTGLLSIIGEVDFPDKGVVRDIAERNFNNWALKEMTVLDCQARLYYYKYVAVIDKDEFLLPEVLNDRYSLLQSLDSYFDKETAGIQLKTKFHLKSWGKSNDSSNLVIGQYINATVPLIDNQKSIIMPSRVQLGTLEIHEFQPLDGLKMFFINPKELVLHHLRSCRPYYDNLQPSNIAESEIKRVFNDHATDFVCQGFRRVFQPNVYTLISFIEGNVRNVRNVVLNLS